MTVDLRDNDFEKISRLVYEQCGINLHSGKKELVKARLGKRLRSGNFASFAEYYRYVTTEEGTDELISMIDSISTNLTYFFREDKHFKKLVGIFSAMKTSGQRPSRLKIWSAGCSTGEEPYSLALTAKECFFDTGVDVRVIATDISTRVLKTAMSGIYPIERLESVPSALVKKYFQKGTGDWTGYCRVKREISEIVQFSRFNLMEVPPRDFVFDVIFCRNVMIYFDKPTQGALVNRFYNCLQDGGYFFVGHSESLTGLDHRFKYIEPSVYRK